MAGIKFDLDRFARQAKAKADTLSSARQRKLIDVYIEHTTAEIASELDRVMATMIPEPNFHIWMGGVDMGAKGYAEVEAMYKTMFVLRSNFMDMDFHRFVVDDHCLVKEYTQRKILSGVNFMNGLLGDALRATGEEPDPDALYLTHGRVVILLPFSEDGLMLGEDSFTAGPSSIRKISEDEIPSNYHDWVKATSERV